MSSTPNKHFIKQSSKLLLEDLRKDREELDDLGELDITTILGSDFDDDSISAADQELIKEALIKGYDLRQYSKDVENNLNQMDKLTINDYFQERENFLTLYSQIQVVDGVLETLETMLNNYYNDLKSIGSEMNSLQERSMSMNHKLNNRKLFDEKLSKFLDAVIIDPEFYNDLTNSKNEINDYYISNLTKLDTKITLFDDYKKISPTICSMNEPQLSKLTVASIQKIQKFLANTLNSNFKKLSEKKQKQKQLANMGYLFQFLFKYSQYIASEVILSYVENNEKYFTSFYKAYVNALMKLLEDGAPGKNDFINIGTGKIKSLFNSTPTKSNGSNGQQQQQQLQQLHTTFSMGNRCELLLKEVLELPPIEPPQSSSSIPFLEAALEFIPIVNNSSGNNGTVKELPSAKYSFDQLFRSMIYFLMDILGSETLFVKDFFLGGEDIIISIFTRSINHLVEVTDNYLANSYDVVGLVLMISMLYRYRSMMNERGVNALDKPFDRLIAMITNRFVKLFSLYLDHIKNTSIKDLKAGISSNSPHYVIRKYADFITTIQAVSANIPTQCECQAILCKAVSELKDSCNALINRLVQEIESKDDQIIFLVNNYAIVVQSIQEYVASSNGTGGTSTNGDIIPPDQDITIKPFYRSFQSVAKKYIDNQITNLKYLSHFISFSWEWGPLVESNVKIDPKDNPSFNASNVTKILHSFEQNWRSAIAAIRNYSINDFSQCQYAQTQIFNQVIMEIYTCYRMLAIIIDKYFESLKSDPNFKSDKIIDEMKEMNSNLNLKYIHQE
ncbi:hypothetical protein RB653_010039 [Dictyostelium firmibasis]|uniref:Vacuolar protein sorting-associated protein 52 homolog n=1 Tax=Dictyostelium firmibasis TaxID=79012 RepID=A0AAN7YLR7_9MYCE